MPPVRVLIALAALILVATLLAGVILRRRYQTCLSFFVYLVAVFVPSLLFTAWPARFYTWDNYFLRETVHNLLKFMIALELGYRTLRLFPAVLVQARRLVFVILAIVTIMTFMGSSTVAVPSDLPVEWHARVLSGTIWLLTGIAAVILWYRLPVDPFHKAILVGFVPYLLLFSVGMRAIVEVGLEASQVFQRVHTIAYVALLTYWNRVAWSTEPVRSASPAPAPSRQPEPA